MVFHKCTDKRITDLFAKGKLTCHFENSLHLARVATW